MDTLKSYLENNTLDENQLAEMKSALSSERIMGQMTSMLRTIETFDESNENKKEFQLKCQEVMKTCIEMLHEWSSQSILSYLTALESFDQFLNEMIEKKKKKQKNFFE